VENEVGPFVVVQKSFALGQIIQQARFHERLSLVESCARVIRTSERVQVHRFEQEQARTLPTRFLTFQCGFQMGQALRELTAPKLHRCNRSMPEVLVGRYRCQCLLERLHQCIALLSLLCRESNRTEADEFCDSTLLVKVGRAADGRQRLCNDLMIGRGITTVEQHTAVAAPPSRIRGRLIAIEAAPPSRIRGKLIAIFSANFPSRTPTLDRGCRGNHHFIFCVASRRILFEGVAHPLKHSLGFVVTSMTNKKACDVLTLISRGGGWEMFLPARIKRGVELRGVFDPAEFFICLSQQALRIQAVIMVGPESTMIDGYNAFKNQPRILRPVHSQEQMRLPF
jgi:hypothetical protein